MSPYRIIRTRHGDYEAHDLGGEVALIQYDTVDAAWIIMANDRRYPINEDLPAAFNRRCVHSVRRFGDVYRFFGLPLPGAAEIVHASDIADAADAARADRALTALAHERVAALIRGEAA